MLGTAKLSPVGELFLENFAIRYLVSSLKIRNGTRGMRFRSIILRVLVDLLKAIEKGGKEFLNSLLAPIWKSHKSTIGALRG